MVFGVGVYAPGEFPCKVDGKITKGYSTWKHMLERCYSPAYQERFPTYIGCTVEPEFLEFQRFMSWAVKDVGFHVEGSCLDKDLLSKGNKVYSRATCVFVPAPVNGVLNKHKARRGNLPVGVSLNGGKYMATLCQYGKNKNLGRFDSVDKAFNAYKAGKEAYIKVLAESYKDSIEPVAYDALMAYTVDLDD